MYLYEWLLQQKIKDRKFKLKDFAEKIGVAPNSLWCIANYRYQAPVKVLLAIEDESDGLVEPWPQQLKCYEEQKKIVEEKKKPKSKGKPK